MRRFLLLIFIFLPGLAWGQTKLDPKLQSPLAVEKATAEITAEKEEKILAKDGVEPVVIEGEQVEHFLETKQAKAKGKVKITHKDTVLYCDEAVYDGKNNIAYVQGKVRIVKAADESFVYGSEFSGQGGVYDFNQQKAELNNLVMTGDPFYGKSNKADRLGQEYNLNKGYITTCSLDQPHYRLVAKKIVIYPDNYVKAYNVFLKAGPVPVLYLPYYYQSLKEKFPVRVAVGSRRDWGDYGLTRWRYDLGNERKGNFLIDKYEERGWGTGGGYKVKTKKYGDFLVEGYQIKDKWYQPKRRLNSLFRYYPDRQLIPEKYLYQQRWRASFYHELKPNPQFSLKSEFNQLSDEFFMKDFFYRHYENSSSTLTYALADYGFSSSALSLFLKKRPNRYESLTEYLPQLEYNYFRQSIAESDFYFESKTSLAKLEKKTPFTSKTSIDASRFYSRNIIDYPNNIRWLNYDIYGGYTTIFYSHDQNRRRLLNYAPEAGIGFNTKLYKVWDSSYGLLGQTVNRTRHVFTPELKYDYSFVRDDLNRRVIVFDNLDSLSNESILEPALSNTLQVKSEKDKWDVLYFRPAAHYIIREKSRGSYWRDLLVDLDISPVFGVSLNSDASYDLKIKRTTAANLDLVFTNYKKDEEQKSLNSRYADDSVFVEQDKGYYFSFGQRYQRLSSTQGTVNFAYDLAPKVRLYNYARYEYNTGDLLEQQHKVRFDLHCWWVNISFNLKPFNEINPVTLETRKRKDTAFWVEFTLKAFPEAFALNYDHFYRDVGDRI